jgi:hypothetical protein
MSVKADQAHLLTRNNLAYFRGEAGNAAGAAAAFEDVLTDYLRVLGLDRDSATFQLDRIGRTWAVGESGSVV